MVAERSSATKGKGGGTTLKRETFYHTIRIARRLGKVRSLHHMYPWFLNHMYPKMYPGL